MMSERLKPVVKVIRDAASTGDLITYLIPHFSPLFKGCKEPEYMAAWGLYSLYEASEKPFTFDHFRLSAHDGDRELFSPKELADILERAQKLKFLKRNREGLYMIRARFQAKMEQLREKEVREMLKAIETVSDLST